MPDEKASELASMVEMMVGLEYISPDEVRPIPRRAGAFGVAIYAPLSQSPCDPDVVLVRGNARQMMLVAEAARAAGVAPEGGMLGRPACTMVPETLRTGCAATSLGCVGNRVYTDLADDELYYAVPGPRLAEVVARLETIVRANGALETFHQDRRERSL
jgi:uncharacterized protein (DUF169 family)